MVAELGAIRVRDHLLAERDLQGLATDVAGRLASSTRRPTSSGLPARASGSWSPATTSGRHSSMPWRPPSRCRAAAGHHSGCGCAARCPLTGLARSVAVVGSRSATTYGTHVAGEIAAGLARDGQVVVSGAAFGIDQAAHRGALGGGGATVAVLACGVDRAYPAAHRALLDHLAEHAAVVAETPPGCAPMQLRFLSRNRLIAALTGGTVVVEAAVRSGALNTANWAARLHRPVMGVPGPVTSAPSEGVHELVRSGAATLVTRAADVLELVGPAGEHLVEARRAPSTARDRLPRRDRQVLDAVPVRQAAATDAIARTAGLGLVEVRSTLERLAARTLVVGSPQGWRLAPDARVPRQEASAS
ncbi:DNA-processing protein DprA [Nocardioides sp.]|uniref:DNA-processing protein DprA n=1 Tax=Nocardioides sp. TaxID=35761 RepID=UPI00352899DD